jgi:hypothetical protein
VPGAARTFNIDSLVKEEASGSQRRGHGTNNKFLSEQRKNRFLCQVVRDISKILTFIMDKLSRMEEHNINNKNGAISTNIFIFKNLNLP